jgi:hypothetical protein
MNCRRRSVTVGEYVDREGEEILLMAIEIAKGVEAPSGRPESAISRGITEARRRLAGIVREHRQQGNRPLFKAQPRHRRIREILRELVRRDVHRSVNCHVIKPGPDVGSLEYAEALYIIELYCELMHGPTSNHSDHDFTCGMGEVEPS